MDHQQKRPETTERLVYGTGDILWVWYGKKKTQPPPPEPVRAKAFCGYDPDYKVPMMPGPKRLPGPKRPTPKWLTYLKDSLWGWMADP